MYTCQYRDHLQAYCRDHDDLEMHAAFVTWRNAGHAGSYEDFLFYMLQKAEGVHPEDLFDNPEDFEDEL